MSAVLALLAGKSWSSTIADFGISRGRLAELRRRALEGITAAVADRNPGPRVAPNRTAPVVEAAVVAAARRYPMEPARSITERTAVPTRTVQRIRRRWNLSKLTRRAPARYRRHRIDPRALALLATARQQRPSLGPSRLAWDVRNQHGVNVSPSWVRDQMHGRYRRRRRSATPRPVWRRYERAHAHSLWHGDFLEKVYLGDGTRAFQLSIIDDHSRTVVFSGIFIEKTADIVVHGLTEAILDYDVVPTAVLFDNESVFRAKVGEFCGRLGIEVIHSTPYHPQTNGKIERAFWDDWREFYWPRLGRTLDELRADLPGYVRYRNEVRGHAALGGRPATARLKNRKPEQPRAPDLPRSRYRDPAVATWRIRPGAVEALRRAAGSSKPVSIMALSPNLDWESVRKNTWRRPRLQTAEVQQVAELVGDGPRTLIVKTLLFACARVSELVGANVEDLDLDGCQLKLRGRLGKERVVPLARGLVVELRAYLAGRTQGPLFVTEQRRAFGVRRVQQVVREVGKRIGVELSPERLRQGMAGALLVGGMPLDRVQECLGNVSIETTQLFYSVPPSPVGVDESYREACRSISSVNGGAR